jgi:hypothetical protein
MPQETDDHTSALANTPAGGASYEDEPVLAFEPRGGRSAGEPGGETATPSGTDGDVVADDAEDRRAP